MKVVGMLAVSYDGRKIFSTTELYIINLTACCGLHGFLYPTGRRIKRHHQPLLGCKTAILMKEKFFLRRQTSPRRKKETFMHCSVQKRITLFTPPNETLEQRRWAKTLRPPAPLNHTRSVVAAWAHWCPQMSKTRKRHPLLSITRTLFMSRAHHSPESHNSRNTKNKRLTGGHNVLAHQFVFAVRKYQINNLQ